MKVQTYQNPGKVTLYGNTQANTFECEKYVNCSMYGHYGGDKFYQSLAYGNFTVEDFKGNNGDGDKLILKKGFTSLKPSMNSSKNAINLSILYSTGNTFRFKTITLSGPSLSEIEGWVDVAKNGTQAAKDENPIIIK